MPKKYIVRLTEAERTSLKEIIKKQKGTSTKVRRAQILLKADVNDESGGWTDQQIAEAFLCRTKTVENIRKRLVLEGFEVTVKGKLRAEPPRQKKLTGEQEAQVIALRLGEPPAGFAQWSLRLLSKQVVELGIVESISHETVRCALKQMA